MTTWRVPVRLAIRDALRHRMRSVLIVLLILVPVAAATGVDILYRTESSTAQARAREFGSADGQLTAGSRAPQESDLLAALPPGSRLVPLPNEESTHLAAPGHLSDADVFLTDALTDPLAAFRIELTGGRAPAAAGELAISRTLARALGLSGSGIGATVTLDGGTALTVVGTVREPFCLDCKAAAAPTNSPIAPAVKAGLEGTDYLHPWGYALDLPAGADRVATAAAVQKLGADVQWRDMLSGGYPGLGDLSRADGQQLQTAAVVTLIAGLGLLEIVLLAGTAFAVGARRQARDLGLLAAQGASPAQVRLAVLAQGLALGVVGSAGGVLAGFVVIRAARPLIERVGNEVVVGTHAGAAEIGVAALVGVVSGVAAAWAPARTAARRRVLDALAARFPAPTTRARRPWAGALVLALGCGIALLASAAMNGGQTGSWFTYAPLSQANDYRFHRYGGMTDTSGALAVLVGVFIAVAGLLLLTPALLALLARAGRHLSGTLRLASRDAARHRHRTGPATAAIAVAVGGAVAISCLIASDREGPNAIHLASVPDRVLAVNGAVAYSMDPAQPAQLNVGLDRANGALSALLPGATVSPVQYLRGTRPQDAPVGSVAVEDVTIEAPLSCRDGCPGGSIQNVAVGTPELVYLATGRTADRDAITAALNAGKAIVLDPTAIGPDGTVRLTWSVTPADGGTQETHEVQVPAVAFAQPTPYGAVPRAFVPTQVAAAQHWTSRDQGVLIDYPAVDDSRVASAIQAAQSYGLDVATSKAPKDWARTVRLGLSAAAALIGLAGVAICVALSAAEGRADLATLAAVGASPGRRRRYAAAQALVLALLGTVIGVGFGFFFARAARPSTGAVSTVVPWGDLLPILIAVPALAALIGLLGARRMPMTRRAD